MNRLAQSLPAPRTALDACIVVPCKNEADHLVSTLAALAAQVDQNGRPLPFDSWETVLLVNNSTDNSLALAREFQQAHPWLALHVVECQFPEEQANIGYVRKVLMDLACERLSLVPKPCSLIVSTDSDTEVEPNWLIQNLAEARRGAEAIGGRILLRPEDRRMLEPQARRIQLWDDRYNLLTAWLEDLCDPQAHDAWPRHYQHFAASLAVKPETYRRVGGLPPRESLEDVAFYEELARHDATFRHSPGVCVYTSARMEGKAARGLAEQLDRWSKGPGSVPVPSVRLWEMLFSVRKQLRTLWRQRQVEGDCSGPALEAVAAKVLMQTEEAREALAQKTFGKAFEVLNVRAKLENGLLAGNAQQPLEEAVEELQNRFNASGVHSGVFVEALQPGAAAI